MTQRSKIEREIATQVLADEDPYPGASLIALGLRNFEGVRAQAWRGGLESALKGRSKRSAYVATTLPRGARVRIPFLPTGPIVELELRSGRLVRFGGTGSIELSALNGTIPVASRELASRCDADVGCLIRVIEAIERARRSVFALMEEGTRWL